MKFFIDTANVEEIKAAYAMGVICGVTTNPSLVAKEGRDFHEVIKEITAIVNGPVSAEVLADDAQEMIKEAKVLAALDEQVVVKIPMTAEGLKAVAALHMVGIRTNVTLVFSANQALMAARAGASYVSPFVGRLEDIGQNGIALIAEIADIFAVHGIVTEIIAASIRRPMHITECAKAGANIATVPYKIIMQALHHPLTDEGIKRFKEDWAEANQ
ncbi:MAG: fructose-6-phosphate aldolase [Megasphaera sp.]|jgi:transaldolase|uniref:fructose-6-phosphate aldolase n=1 Tax=Megasphaera sueciensis TaxID=349094 RepID=UPI003D07E364|nr:fructose-6-phosphate aldolase [Megasphaera sp.]MCI1822714.1 fructose-6-phosphate aldolase [Megasphaera sp.]